jgi:hypothetical protein
MFTRERLKPDFIKDIYQHFIDAGFDFIGGHRWELGKSIKIKTTLEEISNWNQVRLEERLISGFPDEKHSDCDYRYKDECWDILFTGEGYSELRGFWGDYSNHLEFGFIIPENDVLFINKGVHYIKNKLMPFINISKKLWEYGKVDIIQTHLEEDDPLYGFSQILKGENIRFRPFAILSESVYKKFPKDYFVKIETVNLTNNGIYIEQTNRMYVNKLK